MFCGRCGTEAPEATQFCAKCGSTLPAASAQGEGNAQFGGGARCGECQSTDMKRVVHAISEGSWQGTPNSTTVGVGVSGGGFGVGTASTKSKHGGSTELAARLARGMPKALPVDTAANVVIGALLIAGGGGGIFAGLTAREATVGLGGAGAAVLGAFIIFQHFSTAEKRKLQRSHVEALWKQSNEIWERVLVCNRCGHVTDPETGRVVDASAIDSMYPR